jgi:Flp pilus assembly protein TadG
MQQIGLHSIEKAREQLGLLQEQMIRHKDRQNQRLALAGNKGRWRRLRSNARGEEGQGLLEAAVAFLFLLLLLLIMFEMAMIFTSYIALLNMTVQGAIYAAGHADMVTSPPDGAYEQYVSIMQAEALAGNLSWKDVTIQPPGLPATIAPGQPLTVTASYRLTTFASEVIFPMFGRFGLPTHYTISARTSVPIR